MKITTLLLLLCALGAAVFTGLRFFELGQPKPGPRRTTAVHEVEREPTPRHPAFAGPDSTEAAPRGVTFAVAQKNQEAVGLLDEGEFERAVELFEECLEAEPDEAIFARNLAEALARLAMQEHDSEDLDRRDASLEFLERAVELDPTRDNLSLLLDRWKRSRDTERDFWRKLTDHFEISFDGSREELMGRTTPLEIELESAYHEFGELFGFFPVDEGRPRIRVVLYRRESFDNVTGLGDWAGGVFDGTVRVPVEDLSNEIDRLKKTLRHELLHAYVQEAGGPRVPGWLNEGLAQWLEPPFIDGRARGADAARKKLAGHSLYSLDQLKDSLATWNDASAVELAYAQSLAFVAYLERNYGERVLFEMVEGCRDGRTPAGSFQARVGVDLASVLADMAHGL